MSRWLVTGARGMLGVDLVDVLRAEGHEVTALGRGDLDIRDPEAVRDAVAGHAVVVNCAAWTDVDDAEEHEAEAHAVNAIGAGNVAAAADAVGARVVQISTDYVFDGRASSPYAEDAPTAPTSAYGRTKLAGEQLVRDAAADHIVVRTAWLYGAHGSCFPRTIARLAKARGTVAVVTDQIGQPTWTRDVAELVLRLIAAEAPAGTYHGTSRGEASWYEFARAVVVTAGLDADRVVGTTGEELVRPAPRPAYSAMAATRLGDLGLAPIAHWRERWDVAGLHVLAARG